MCVHLVKPPVLGKEHMIAGDMALAIGQSVAYGLAFIVVLFILKNAEKDTDQ